MTPTARRALMIGDTLYRRAARGATLPPCVICGASTVQIVNGSPRCAVHPFADRATVGGSLR